MIILKTMDICEECPKFDPEVRNFFKSLGLKIVLCKKYEECNKNIVDLYNFTGEWEGNTDGEQ